MTFLYPQWFWAVIPCVLITLYLTKRSKHQTLIAPHIAKAMGLEASKNSTTIKLFTAAWLIAILSLSGPSINDVTRPSVQSNDARVVVMDMSLSMYARDVSPSRLEQARYKVTDMLNQWQDGQTGLVVYAGDAYSVAPLTRDSQSLLNHLPLLSPAIMPYPGARAEKGVEQAIDMLTNAGFQSGQIILVIDDLSAKEKQAIEALIDNRWQLAILAIATENGAPIPLPEGGMLQTSNGTTVVATSQFGNMNTLARNVGGLFIPIQHNNSDVDTITSMSELLANTSRDTDSKREIETWQNKGYWLTLPLLAFGLLMFRRGVLFSLMLGVTLTTATPKAQANPWLNDDQKAYQSFQSGDFQAAQNTFSDKEWQGISAYENGDYQMAIEALSGIESTRAEYNLGNAYAQSGDLEKAIEQYQRVLAQEPNHQDAQDNLSLVEQLRDQQQQQSQGEDSSESQQSEQDSQQQDSGQQDSGQQDSSDQEQESSDSSSQSQQQNSDSQPSDSSSHSDAEEGQETQPQDSSESPSEPSSEQQDSAQNAPEPTPSEQNQEQSSEQSALESQLQDQESPAEKAPISAQELSEQEQQKQRDLQTLDRVEAARDPSRLIRAQLQLQAQQKPKPQVTEKNW
ncbi:VWA domain-containing protein [Vibrio agarivorans]|uniref:VWA domain-containing protein n=1 Tax=Vibrio agarivorans TaxID=153622 RepID=A0ABT7Y5F3_9VIBR|nr:VWA domain-containing protein [Vibrio agarivorans]MDN2483279.1 VWA domain-containing protein [Vibrio agarivorans]